MHTATNYYLFSLAISDLMILVLGKFPLLGDCSILQYVEVRISHSASVGYYALNMTFINLTDIMGALLYTTASSILSILWYFTENATPSKPKLHNT